MTKIDASFVFLGTWQRILCAFIAVLMFYNYLLPWPPVDGNQYAMGFSGVLAWSLAAVFGNKVRGARLLSVVALLIFLAAFISKLRGHAP